MAYDFGSQTLGIKNPFKVEGCFKVTTGIVLIASGIFALTKVSAQLQTSQVFGYIYTGIGFLLIAGGAINLAKGMSQLLRYFVGRSVPASLAANLSPSKVAMATKENNSQAPIYSGLGLFSMLMGRTNPTFIEPVDWLERLLHTLFRNLTFLPYPLRHLAQEIGSLLINFIVGVALLSILWFVVSSGLAGKLAQQTALPVMSMLLLIFFMITWHHTASNIHNEENQRLHSMGLSSLLWLLVLSIAAVVVSGSILDNLVGSDVAIAKDIRNHLLSYSVWNNLALLMIACSLVVIGIAPNLFMRMKKVTPKTEVSEYRESLQESIHPNEIFINVENIILANRRYKEVPNRLYINYDPKLEGESAGKGSFFGEVLIESQPALASNGDEIYSNIYRCITTVLAQLCILIGYLFLVMLLLWIGKAIEHFTVVQEFKLTGSSSLASEIINTPIFYLFGWLTFNAAGRILSRSSALFWGELHFSSLLLFLKTQGTFTESKISTGMSINDSTRSENTVVRSSITPWLLLSRINTSIFATTGSSNFESPRFIMCMSQDDFERDAVVTELKAFLKGRESIASITSSADLRNTNNIHLVNQQTRALSEQARPTDETIKLTEEEQAAGYQRNQLEQE